MSTVIYWLVTRLPKQEISQEISNDRGNPGEGRAKPEELIDFKLTM
jgi:hypothetical protein